MRLALLGLLLAPALAAQEPTALERAQLAYTALDYGGAITAAHDALSGSLSRDGRVTAYEILGYAYGALDSTRQAVEAFQQLIFLDPDREPDVERVSPRITSLYASALGQVLVVRRLHVDSASFVAGQGAATVHYELSRPAEASTRLIGPGSDQIINAQSTAGSTSFAWPVADGEGRPLRPGDYQIITTAREGDRTEFSSSPLSIRILHSALDTLPHLTSLPGYSELPEQVTPPRDWKPLVLSVLYTGIGTGAFLAIENGRLGTGPRTAFVGVSGAAVATGLAMSLRKPDPRPSPSNILYNQLLRELLARQNAELAEQNEGRRKQVVVTVSEIR